jgi:hypothetical protein
MTIEMIPEQAIEMTPTEAYETYQRVAKVVGEVVNESYVELLNQLANPWILASLDFSEPEIAAFFKLLCSTKITVEFTNPMEAQQVVQNFHRVMKPKLLRLIKTHSQSDSIAIAGEVRV